MGAESTRFGGSVSWRLCEERTRRSNPFFACWSMDCFAALAMTLRLCSQHLMHVDHDAVGMPRADADEQVFHQPAVLFGSGFEFRHRAKIDQRGIDSLAFGDPVQQFLRTEPDADILDVDNRAVVHLKSVFRFQFGKAVRADDLEIRAARKDGPADALAAHFAAEDRNDPPDTIAEIAGDDRRADPDDEAEDIFGLKCRGHGSSQPSRFSGREASEPSCVAAARSPATERQSE